MPKSQYAIGLSLETMVNFEDLGLPVPFQEPFSPYSTIQEVANSSIYGHGWEVTALRYGFLTYAQRNTLKSTYCPGKSQQNIFIRVLDDSNAWVTCRTTMIWDSETPIGNNKVGDVRMVFRIIENFGEDVS